jgi:hypothetical protein
VVGGEIQGLEDLRRRDGADRQRHLHRRAFMQR